jgi:hypothetical protein
MNLKGFGSKSPVVNLKPEVKTPNGRSTHGWKNNIGMDPKEMVCFDVERIHLTQIRV